INCVVACSIAVSASAQPEQARVNTAPASERTTCGVEGCTPRFSGDRPAFRASADKEDSPFEFYCHTGYTLAECVVQHDRLRALLMKFNLRNLGQWRWVLVRSEDWGPILRRVGRDADSPAFTVLENRVTFLEEALFVPVPGRDHTLLEKWRVPPLELLEYAVAHELGHAVCGERDERQASVYGRELIDSSAIRCR